MTAEDREPVRPVWEDLVERHLGAVHAFAWSLLGNAHAAEDAVQETFLRARIRSSSFEGLSTERTWLLGITRRVCLESRRREVRKPPPRPWTAPLRPEEALMDAETLSDARRRFARLSGEDREILTLSVSEGLGAERIASILDCSEGAARVRLHRARARWRILSVGLGGPG